MSSGPGPTPETTLALIFGASRWPDAPKFDDAPSFERSADALISVVRDPQGLGLPWRNIKSSFNSIDDAAEQLEQATSFIERHRRLTSGTELAPRDLLVLYVGHGDFEGEARDFYLSIRRTSQQRPLITSITARELGNLILRSAYDLRTYLIIDCCFAAALQYGFMTSPLGLAELKLHEALPAGSLGSSAVVDDLPASGVVLLAAAGLNKPALAPSGHPLTAFTTTLLDILKNGYARLGPRLSLQDLHLLIESRVSELFPGASRPEMRPLQQTRGRVELVPFFPNPAFDEVLRRREAEAVTHSEERRKADEAARLAEKGHKADEASRLAEEQRKADEAARLAEEQHQAKGPAEDKGKTKELAGRVGDLVRRWLSEVWPSNKAAVVLTTLFTVPVIVIGYSIYFWSDVALRDSLHVGPADDVGVIRESDEAPIQSLSALTEGFAVVAYNGNGQWVMSKGMTYEEAANIALRVCNSRFSKCQMAPSAIRANENSCLAVASDGQLVGVARAAAFLDGSSRQSQASAGAINECKTKTVSSKCTSQAVLCTR